MTLFISLIIAHLLGDFFLQSKETVIDKQARGIKSTQLYIHGLIHGTLSFAALLIVSKAILASNTSIALLALMAIGIAVSHIIIDLLKREASANRKCAENSTAMFLLDQLAHILVLLIVSQHLYPFDWNLGEYINLQQILIYACALLLLTRPSSLFIQNVFKDLRIELKANNNADAPKDVGQTIGMVERIIIFFAVLAAQWPAIGFLIAAKSVFRFGDLTDSEAKNKAEMILLGTLLSFGIGIAISWLAIWLSQLQF